MNAPILRFLGAISIVGVTLPTPADANAPAGRYVVTNGGTVNGTVYDTKTKLTWQQTVPSTTYAWADAKTYCTSMGSGWRLPTIKEVQTIVDVSQGVPSIDPTAFPSTPANYYWSSSSVASSPSYAWAVDFHYGSTHGYVVFGLYNVRCVR
jgi:glucose dehydrogenase